MNNKISDKDKKDWENFLSNKENLPNKDNELNKNVINELRDDYPNVRIGQWFLDPLNPRGPDYNRNKERILNKVDSVDATFVTTSPSVLNFLQN